jgi:hypothetical protein
MVGPSEAEKMLNTAIFVVSAGSNDLMKTALQLPNNISTPDYESYLVTSMVRYIKVLSMNIFQFGSNKYIL